MTEKTDEVERWAAAMARAYGYSWFGPEDEERYSLKRSQDGFRKRAAKMLATLFPAPPKTDEVERLTMAAQGTPRWRYKGFGSPEHELVQVRVGDLRAILASLSSVEQRAYERAAEVVKRCLAIGEAEAAIRALASSPSPEAEKT